MPNTSPPSLNRSIIDIPITELKSPNAERMEYISPDHIAKRSQSPLVSHVLLSSVGFAPSQTRKLIVSRGRRWELTRQVPPVPRYAPLANTHVSLNRKEVSPQTVADRISMHFTCGNNATENQFYFDFCGEKAKAKVWTEDADDEFRVRIYVDEDKDKVLVEAQRYSGCSVRFRRLFEIIVALVKGKGTTVTGFDTLPLPNPSKLYEVSDHSTAKLPHKCLGKEKSHDYIPEPTFVLSEDDANDLSLKYLKWMTDSRVGDRRTIQCVDECDARDTCCKIIKERKSRPNRISTDVCNKRRRVSMDALSNSIIGLSKNGKLRSSDVLYLNRELREPIERFSKENGPISISAQALLKNIRTAHSLMT